MVASTQRTLPEGEAGRRIRVDSINPTGWWEPVMIRNLSRGKVAFHYGTG